MTQEQQAAFRRLVAAYEDHEQFCADHYAIRDKSGVRVPMVLMPAQRKLSRMIREIDRKGRPIRIVALKGRQVMVSSGVAAEYHRRTAFRRGRRTLVVAHNLASSYKIFDYYRQMHVAYKERPLRSEVRGVHLALPEGEPIEGRLSYANASEIECWTAGSKQSARSFSGYYVHASEFAFWPDASTFLAGLGSIQPKTAGTITVVESTANGIGNAFSDLWELAMSGRSEWAPFFFSWWEHPEYRMPVVGSRERFESKLTPAERELMARHNLTLEQMQWRRFTIDTELMGNERTFSQEYPSTPEEAFLTTGRPRFRTLDIKRQPRKEPETNGRLVQEQVGPRVMTRFQPDDRGPLAIWKHPVPEHSYVIGVDTAKGIDAFNEPGRTDPDYSVAQVLSIETLMQAARFRERVTPATFASEVYELGKYYQWAFLCIENTGGYGFAVIEELLRLGYPIERLYRGGKGMAVDDLGFATTMVSKPMLISRLDRLFLEGRISVYDPVTIAELYSYVVDARGQTNAEKGKHDDCVMALALAVEGRDQAIMQQEREQAEQRSKQEREAEIIRTGGWRPRGFKQTGAWT